MGNELVLRDYQTECIEAHWSALADPKACPLFVLPCGAGKSIIIADVIRRAAQEGGWRTLVLSHVREILLQDYDKFRRVWPGNLPPAGLHCAALGQRDTTSQVIFAGVQSAISKDLGPFDMAIIDEAHLVPHKGMGRYRTLLAKLRERNPAVRLLGYTATPYRLDSGWLHKGEGALFTDVAFDLPVDRLVEAGYLAPLVSKRAQHGEIDLSGVHMRGGEYIEREVEDAAISVVDAAVKELVETGEREARKCWLIVCAGVRHARAVMRLLDARGISCRGVFGDTKADDRTKIIDEFRNGEFTALVGVNVFTIGFDVPRIDMLALLRATQSTALYVQIVGRAMRISPDTGKIDALVLDFGQNVKRHGPINMIDPNVPSEGPGPQGAPNPWKECPECGTYVGKATQVCPECGYEWPVNHAPKADTRPVLAPPDPPPPVTLPVHRVDYKRWMKTGKPDSLCVTYHCNMQHVREWVCLEHGGYAGEKADAWWLKRGDEPVPETVTNALNRTHELRQPTHIEVVPDGNFERVRRVWFAPVSEAEEERWLRKALDSVGQSGVDDEDDDEDPF